MHSSRVKKIYLPEKPVSTLHRNMELRLKTINARADIVIQKYPDLDNIAGSLALNEILNINFPAIKTAIYWEDGLHQNYLDLVNQICGKNISESFLSPRQFNALGGEMVFTVDTMERSYLPYDFSKKYVARIDHHESVGDKWWDYGFVDHRYPSAGMMLFRIFEMCEINKTAQQLILLSLVSDVGSEKSKGYEHYFDKLNESEIKNIYDGFGQAIQLPEDVLIKTQIIGDNIAMLELSIADQKKLSPDDIKDFQVRKAARSLLVKQYEKDITVIIFEEDGNKYDILIYNKNEGGIVVLQNFIAEKLGHQQFGFHDNRGGVMGLDKIQLDEVLAFIKKSSDL